MTIATEVTNTIDTEKEELESDYAIKVNLIDNPEVTAWIELDDSQDGDDILSLICEAFGLDDESQESENFWKIVDSKGIADCFNITKLSLDDIAKLVEAVEEYPDTFEVFYNWIGTDYGDMYDAVEAYLDKYQGTWEDREAYAIDYFQGTSNIYRKLDELCLVDYMNWEEWVNDCENSGDIEIFEVGCEIIVFSNH